MVQIFTSVWAVAWLEIPCRFSSIYRYKKKKITAGSRVVVRSASHFPLFSCPRDFPNVSHTPVGPESCPTLSSCHLFCYVEVKPMIGSRHHTTTHLLKAHPPTSPTIGSLLCILWESPLYICKRGTPPSFQKTKLRIVVAISMQ